MDKQNDFVNTVEKEKFVTASTVVQVKSVNGNPAWQTNYYRFDGKQDSISFETPNVSFEDNTPFSIAVVARMYDDKRFLCAYRWHFDRSRFTTRGDDRITLRTGVNDDLPHILVFTYAPQNEDRPAELKLYVDGTLVDSATTSGSPFSTYPLHDVAVGMTTHGGGVYSQIDVAKVSFFDYALGESEIALFNKHAFMQHRSLTKVFTFLGLLVVLLCLFRINISIRARRILVIIQKSCLFCLEYLTRLSHFISIRARRSLVIIKKICLFCLKYLTKLSRFLSVLWTPRLVLLYCSVFLVFLIFRTNKQITDSAIINDATQNLKAAYNYYRHGVISYSRDSDKVGEQVDIMHEEGFVPLPTNHREPLPCFVTGMFMRLHPGFGDDVTMESLLDGEHARKVKQVNLFWVGLLLVGAGLLSYVLTGSKLYPLITIFLVSIYFTEHFSYVDRLITEIPASALLVLSTLFLVLSVQKGKTVYYISAGLFLGVLILTKAVFYYIAFAVVLFVLIYLFLVNKEKKLAYKAIRLSAFVLALAVVVMPWMVRNKIHFGKFEITQRGGVVLLARAEKNKMNRQELIASFYIYGPRLYKDAVKGTVWQLKSCDYRTGGLLQRLRRTHSHERLPERLGVPEMTHSFYTKARAERVKARREFSEAGHPNPAHAADDFLQKKAIRMIMHNPVKHCLMTVPFFWRGMWCFSNPNIFFLNKTNTRYFNEIVNFLSLISLVLIFIISVFRRDWRLLAFSILPVGMLFFYAFFSHNISRYNAPVIPVAMLSLFVLFRFFIKLVKKGFDETSLKT